MVIDLSISEIFQKVFHMSFNIPLHKEGKYFLIQAAHISSLECEGIKLLYCWKSYCYQTSCTDCSAYFGACAQNCLRFVMMEALRTRLVSGGGVLDESCKHNLGIRSKKRIFCHHETHLAIAVNPAASITPCRDTSSSSQRARSSLVSAWVSQPRRNCVLVGGIFFSFSESIVFK